METITLLAIQTGLLFLISFYLLYKLRNKIESIKSKITDIEMNKESTNNFLKKIDSRLIMLEYSVYAPLYEQGNKIYFKNKDGVEKSGIIEEVFVSSSHPPQYDIRINKETARIRQEDITAWE